MTSAPTPRVLVAVGAVGSVLATAGSYWTAATPLYFRTDPPAVVDLLGPQAPPARIAWYGGCLLLVLAWLGFGRLLWAGVEVGWRTVRTAGLVWAVPWLVAVPAASRDLWAYAAQAKVAAAGFDPYRVGPSVLRNAFAANVTPRWVHTPSPYGPLWTMVGRALGLASGDHQMLAVLLLRLPAAAGLVLLALTVPALARRVGGPVTTACWLLLANPMVVIHGVGGGHNDLLMVGLTSAGLLAAVSAGPRWRAMLVAGVLVGAAAAVKLPAIVAAPFLPLLWARFAPGAPRDTASYRDPARWRSVAAGLAPALGAALAVLAVTTVAAGYGLGWLRSANTSDHGGGPVGTGLLVVALVALWVVAVRRSELPLLAVALLAVSLVSRFSPAWYWFWPLGIAALFLRARLALFVVAVGSVTEVFYVRPNGQSLLIRPELVIVLAAVLVWLVLDRHWRPVVASGAAVDARS